MITLYKKDDFVSTRKGQYDAFHKDKPGSWFANATKKLADIADDVPVLALGIESGEAIVFNAHGEAMTKKVSKKIKGENGDETVVSVDGGVLTQGHRGWIVDLSDGRVGCSPVVAEHDGHRYASGMMIVTGPGNAGKTPLVHALGEAIAGDEPYATIRFGEPLSGYNTDFDEFIREIAYAIIHYRVIVVDSLKNVIGAAGGNATSGGISRGAFDLLSDLGAVAASRGCVIIASLNPTSNDARIVELVQEAARSNSTSLAIASQTEGEWTILTRTGEGLQRLTHTLRTHYGDYSVLEIGTEANGHGKVTSSKIKQTVITATDLESTLRRLTGN